MPEYYLAETIPLRHGVRVYAGTQQELEGLQTTLKKSPFWENTFHSEPLLQPVELLSECTVEYPMLRLDYMDLSGERYKLRAGRTTLHYLWLVCKGRCYRMVRPELDHPLWDLADSPHGWRLLPEAFLGVPGVLTLDEVVLSGQVFFLDDVFTSRQALYADILTPPPAVNLQCTFDEIFAPVQFVPGHQIGGQA